MPGQEAVILNTVGKKICTENMILEPAIMEPREQALRILREECLR